MQEKREKVIIIGGATASGKSDFALKIARHFGTEIISADSMQIYRDMNIGTAKVTPDEMQGIPHHMLDIVDAKDNFSVAEYVAMARKVITHLNDNGKIPVIVGGTGLYIDALMYDFEFNNADIDMELRHTLEKEALVHGNEYIHDMLKELDPTEAERIHPNNVKRVIRAIEICKTTGGKKSENKKTLHYDVAMFVIDTDRELLYDRINRRVDIMLDNGLEDEVKNLVEKGVTFDKQSMQGIGYKEWQGYFSGAMSLEEVSRLIKKNSRNYAKRQITWFYNKYRDIAHLTHVDEVDNAIDIIQNTLYK